MTTAAVTNCKSSYNQYINGGIITSSNAAKAFSNLQCLSQCAYANGPSAVDKAWSGYNFVDYVAPTTCPNPSSASIISSSLWLGLLYLLF